MGGDSFEVLVQKGKEAWNEALGKVEVEGGTLDQYRTSKFTSEFSLENLEI